MARIERVEARLREWGEWGRSGGKSDQVSGYPTRNCLHPDWGAPSHEDRVVIKVAREGLGGITDVLVRQTVSVKIRETLLLHYWENLPVMRVAERLGCSAATVDQRIWKAHALLAAPMRN